jgi:hypothetical protein
VPGLQRDRLTQAARDQDHPLDVTAHPGVGGGVSVDIKQAAR